MTTLTIQDWTNYLNRKTLGFNCPICGHNHWQTQPDDNGDVLCVRVSDANNSMQTNEDGIYDLGEVGKASEPLPPPSLLQGIVLIRCGHCGWVGMFDHKFVEEHLHDDE